MVSSALAEGVVAFPASGIAVLVAVSSWTDSFVSVAVVGATVVVAAEVVDVDGIADVDACLAPSLTAADDVLVLPSLGGGLSGLLLSCAPPSPSMIV